jgi:translocation and assembly module TamA
VAVVPGTPVRVGQVQVAVSGPATLDAPLGTEAVARARDTWSLRPGAVFRQADWVEAKDRALAVVRASPYAGAQIVHSEARVDPVAGRADLDVQIASGPRFLVGPLQIQGLQRYPPELIENFNTLREGEPYTQAALDDFVRRLAITGYFTSVQASIDPAAADHERAPIRVAVIEAPTHHVEGRLQYSTDTEFGIRATYTNMNLDGAGLRLRLEGRLESLERGLALTLTRPPTPSHWIDKFIIGAGQSDIENSRQTTAGVGWERRGIDERNSPLFSATYYYDREEPQGAPATTAKALYVEGGYVIRRADSLLDPTRGWMAEVRAGGGIPGVSTEGFGRVTAKLAAWYPFDVATELALRAEGGAVMASGRDGIPSILLFRTGGDTTVRGYAYQSLGVPLGDAIVGGRYYAVASAELIRWFGPVWGLAAFVDAGNAGDTLSELEPAIGAGLGLRLRTPIGPFRLDVAHGFEDGGVRLHFSVGLSF